MKKALLFLVILAIASSCGNAKYTSSGRVKKTHDPFNKIQSNKMNKSTGLYSGKTFVKPTYKNGGY